jgi:hypothetical protein
MLSRLSIAFKALSELGPRQIGQFALYRLALRTGWLRRLTQIPARTGIPFQADALKPLLQLPDPKLLREAILTENLPLLWVEAAEIIEGRARFFGGKPAVLQLGLPGPLAHWTEYEAGLKIQGVDDIKFVWEPGRFGWAYTLGRAYWMCGEERYSQAFWNYTEAFWEANPPYLGPHWSSAQEVALRLIALAFAAQIFSGSQHSTPDRLARLAQAIADHAARIPPSLAYARAQNNNHLLSEAAGLYTAGICLADHPHAYRWRELGWKWFNRGLVSQIDADGSYMQHSTNYHRLMLQLGLWMDSLSGRFEQHLPEASLAKLVKATHWLFRLLDHTSGQVPNLGPNDGAYILPLTVQPFGDFRPVLQAAGHAFLGEMLLERGPWDEMSRWLPGDPARTSPAQKHEARENPARLELPDAESWAYLRTARFTSRPGHADQLHFDLWWRGLNLAQDAGTYLYSGQPPWENALARTPIHNTVVLDGQEQMTWAGRFLWLDWSQASLVSGEKSPAGLWTSLTASHNGYQHRGCVHRRSVSVSSREWLVEDQMLPVKQSNIALRSTHLARLHWLLPDWPWELDSATAGDRLTLRLKSPHGWLRLDVGAFGGQPEDPLQPLPIQLELVRAGERLFGRQIPDPTWGWVSPTYGIKIPALSASYLVVGALPIRLESRWILPGES